MSDDETTVVQPHDGAEDEADGEIFVGLLPPSPELPILRVLAGDLPSTVQVLHGVLQDHPMLFSRGNRLVWLLTNSDGELFTHPVTVSNVVMATHELCMPIRTTSKGEEVLTTLPDRVARMYLEKADWHMRELAGISTAPIMHVDGSIVTAGYDAVTQVYVCAPAVNVPEAPSKAQAERALLTLRHRFRTFPFADAIMIERGDRKMVDIREPPGLHESSFINALLTSVARASLRLAPGTLFTAPEQSGSGVGKGLLVRAMSVTAFGTMPHAVSVGRGKEEFDKSLGSALMGGQPVVFIDNLNSTELRSDTLASAITERPARVRILGQSTLIELNSSAWIVLTGNALGITEDLTRRFIWIHLDAKMDDPERREFAGDLLKYVSEHRVELLECVLTILRYGRHNAGKLTPGRRMGSFEQWCQWVRDPLMDLGCKDPAASIDLIRESDPKRQSLLEFFTMWHREHGNEPVAVAKIDDSVLKVLGLDGKTRQQIASAIKRKTGSRISGMALLRSKQTFKAAALYQLEGKPADAVTDDGDADVGGAKYEPTSPREAADERRQQHAHAHIRIVRNLVGE